MSRPVSSWPPRSRHCANPAPTFPAESCSRCPRARPPGSGRSYAARGGTSAAAQITRIGRRRLTRFGLTLAQTTKSLGVPAAGPAREATVTQQAVTVLVPEHPAPASEKPAEPGAGRMRRWSPASCWWKRSRSTGCAVSTDAPVSPRADTTLLAVLRAMEQHPTARSARMAAGIGHGPLPAYQRALGRWPGRR